MHKKNGFTLLEMMIVTTLITIVSALSVTAMISSSETIQLNQALALIQQDARAIMMTLSREVEFAVKQAPTGFSLPAGAVGAEVNDDGRSFTFQVPTNEEFTAFSSPITLIFDEDSNRILRIEDGEETVIGGANSVIQGQFELRDQNTILRVRLRTESPLKTPEERTAEFTLQSDIFLMN